MPGLVWGTCYGLSLAAILVTLSIFRQQVLLSYEQGPQLAADWDRWQSDRAGQPAPSTKAKWTRPPATVWFGTGFVRLLLMATGLWTVVFCMLAFALHGMVFGGKSVPPQRESGDVLG